MTEEDALELLEGLVSELIEKYLNALRERDRLKKELQVSEEKRRRAIERLEDLIRRLDAFEKEG